MILGITGHRHKTFNCGYKIPNPVYNKVKESSRKIFSEFKPEAIISGMAIGSDQWCTEVAIEQQIPFIAAVPFLNQELFWPKDSQHHYRELLEQAKQVEIVSSGGYASWKMQVRNQWIVDQCDVLLAFYSGMGSGGTFNCIQYAKSKNKQIIEINPLERATQ